MKPTTISISNISVPCPGCQGTGQRAGFAKEHGKRQPCLACRGTGRVSADRVCPTCNHFIDLCTCPRDRAGQVIILEDEMFGGKGYYFNKSLKQFTVDVVRGGKHWYIASRTNEAEAAAIAREAQQARTTEELEALKAKYAKQPRNHNNGRHAPEAEDESGPRQDTLRAIYRAVDEEDARGTDANDELEEADNLGRALNAAIASGHLVIGSRDPAPSGEGDPDAELVTLLRAALSAQRELQAMQRACADKELEVRAKWDAYNRVLREIQEAAL